MLSNILSLFSGLVGLFDKIAVYMRDSRLIKSGEDKQSLKSYEEILNDIRKAKKARQSRLDADIAKRVRSKFTRRDK